MNPKQLNLNLFPDSWNINSPQITAAIDKLSSESGAEARGAVFTRSEVVDFILDLSGYTTDHQLYKKRLLEPSFGGGDFLFPSIRRLFHSWVKSGERGNVVDQLGESLRAVELHQKTFESTRYKVIDQLKSEGINSRSAISLADKWLIQGDFLLVSLKKFDFVLGNPPYVRQELIPAPLMAEYRNRYQTIYDRADLYIPFIERSLNLLDKDGCLGFICSDRWMKNRYGGPLRRIVADKFHFKIFVDMVDTPAFKNEVIAYPAIVIISRNKPGATRAAYRPAIDRETLAALAVELRSGHSESGKTIRELEMVTNGAEPWLLESSNQMSLIRHLEQQFPTLEEAGCKVGIGVATGADKAYIGNYDSLDVEPDRKLPLVTTRDILTGEVNWQGLGVINPFEVDGRLVNLCHYPRLSQYLESRKDIIAKRHCAKKNPINWYRTIDRIDPIIASKPKLLIPDIKGKSHIVYEKGEFYPHHNLYYITSEEWDLRALQAILLSGISQLFIGTYSTRMRGGYMRFQAQYLRRIRIPYWHQVPDRLKEALIIAAERQDMQACNRTVCEIYMLDHSDFLSFPDLENEI